MSYNKAVANGAVSPEVPSNFFKFLLPTVGGVVDGVCGFASTVTVLRPKHSSAFPAGGGSALGLRDYQAKGGGVYQHWWTRYRH